MLLTVCSKKLIGLSAYVISPIGSVNIGRTINTEQPLGLYLIKLHVICFQCIDNAILKIESSWHVQ